MIRLVSCGVSESRQAAIDRERDTQAKETIRNKKRKEGRKNNSRTEYVLPSP
jgi:hypothetical protein